MKLLKKIFLLLLVVSVLFVSCGNNEIKNPGDGNVPGTDVPGTDVPGTDVPGTDPVKPDLASSRVYFKITPVDGAAHYIVYMDGKLQANVQDTNSIICLGGYVGVHSIYLKVVNADDAIIAEWFDDVEYTGVDRHVTVNPSKASESKVYVRNAVSEPRNNAKGLFCVSDETIMINGNHFFLQSVFMDFEPTDKGSSEKSKMPISPSQPDTIFTQGTVVYENGKVILTANDSTYNATFTIKGGKLYDEKQNVYTPMIGEKGEHVIDSKWQFAPIYASKDVLNQLLEAVMYITDDKSVSFNDIFPSVTDLAYLPEDLVIYVTLEMTSTGMNYLIEVTPKADFINGTVSLKGALKFSVHIKTDDEFNEDAEGKVFVYLPGADGNPVKCNYSLMDSDGSVAILTIPVGEPNADGVVPTFKVPFRRVNVEYPVLDRNAFKATKTLSIYDNMDSFTSLINKTGLNDSFTNLINAQTIGGESGAMNIIGSWAPIEENANPRLTNVILPMGMARHGSEMTMIDHYDIQIGTSQYLSGVKMVFKDHTIFTNGRQVDAAKGIITSSVAISTSSDERKLMPSDFKEYHFKKEEIDKVTYTESVTNAMNLMNVELKFGTDNKVNFYIDGKIEERMPDVYYSEHNERITVALDPAKLMQSGSNPEPGNNKLPMIRICVNAPYDESTNTSVLLTGNSGEKYGVTWN